MFVVKMDKDELQNVEQMVIKFTDLVGNTSK